MVGAANTVRVAVLLADPAVVVCVVVTPELVLLLPPGVLLATLKVTVQVTLLAGIVIPVKLSEVAFAAMVFVLAPTHVPPTVPPTALIPTIVGEHAPPVRAEALLLVRVRVTREVPPD